MPMQNYGQVRNSSKSDLDCFRACLSGVFEVSAEFDKRERSDHTATDPLISDIRVTRAETRLTVYRSLYTKAVVSAGQRGQRLFVILEVGNSKLEEIINVAQGLEQKKL